MPKKEGLYIVLGDPGTGGAPNRNAPALIVFKVDGFPQQKAEIVVFYWGNGEGSIAPFVIQICRFMAYYKPIFVGVDSTATHKNTSETIKALFDATKDDPDGTLVLGQRSLTYLEGPKSFMGCVRSSLTTILSEIGPPQPQKSPRT